MAARDAINSNDERQAEQRLQFTQYMKRLPFIPLEVEPTSQRQMLADYVLAGLSVIFPPAALKKKQEYMSPVTFSSVIRRAKVSHARDVVTEKLKNATVWFVFAFWRASFGAVCVRNKAMGFLRYAISDCYVDGEPHECVSDAVFLQVYEARAPYVLSRFALRFCALVWCCTHLCWRCAH